MPSEKSLSVQQDSNLVPPLPLCNGCFRPCPLISRALLFLSDGLVPSAPLLFHSAFPVAPLLLGLLSAPLVLLLLSLSSPPPPLSAPPSRPSVAHPATESAAGILLER